MEINWIYDALKSMGIAGMLIAVSFYALQFVLKRYLQTVDDYKVEIKEFKEKYEKCQKEFSDKFDKLNENFTNYLKDKNDKFAAIIENNTHVIEKFNDKFNQK